MKLPLWPPIVDEIIRNHKNIVKLLGKPPVDGAGRYLHWDKFRHLEPPDGFSVEEYWAATKISRNSIRKELPFLCKKGKPFVFCVPDSLAKELHNIDISCGGSLSSFGIRADEQKRDEHLIRSLFLESIYSSQLEGASTTIDVAKKMLREKRDPSNRSEQMIFNNYRAMEFIKEYKNEKITPNIVLELHKIVTDKTLDNPEKAGKFRTNEDQIEIIDQTDQITAHVPPNAELLQSRMQSLCAFANSDNDTSQFIHPIVRAIIVHFMLAYDHPFVDGNGRTARALFYLIAIKNKYWLTEYLSISAEIIKSRRQYDRAFLYTETDDNDMTYFLYYNVHILNRAYKHFTDSLKRRIEESREAESVVGALNRNLNHRQIALLRHALKYHAPQYTIAEHQGAHNVSYNTARTDLLELERMGLLASKKRGKKLVFIKPKNFNAVIVALKKV